jgi:hypothetical protein
MNNTFELFSLMCERDSCIFFVLEQTESDLSKINWLRDVIRFHSNNVDALRQVFIVLYSYQISFGFLRSNLNLNCGLHDHEIRIYISMRYIFKMILINI